MEINKACIADNFTYKHTIYISEDFTVNLSNPPLILTRLKFL